MRARNRHFISPPAQRLMGTRLVSELLAHGVRVQALARKQTQFFRRVGPGVIFGRGVTLLQPDRTDVLDRVAIDDYVMLDAGGGGESGICIGDDVIISRNAVIQAKESPVTIGNPADIGCNTVISSIAGVNLGHAVLVAANCYIGGGRYGHERIDTPMMDQGLETGGPVEIGDDVWVGAAAVVTDGCKISRGAIVGAGAVVNSDIPEYAIAVGVPPRVTGYRGSSCAHDEASEAS